MTSQPDEISDDQHAELFSLITSSFKRLIGRPLTGEGQGPQWLYREAPFAVLAHDGGDDPRFIYANHTAQACFDYSWRELIGLPSRLSSEAPERAERQRLLDAVGRNGFISDYKGVRISKSGRRFWIENAIVWQLIDEEGRLHGQAAMFSEWKDVLSLR